MTDRGDEAAEPITVGPVVIDVLIEAVNDQPQLAALPALTVPEDGVDKSVDLDEYYSDVETPTAEAVFEVVSTTC